MNLMIDTMNIVKKAIALIFVFFLIGGLSGPQTKLPNDDLLKDINGEELKGLIDSYKGKKALLVNVWATWCAPCVEEFPEIVKIQRKYEDRLRVIFISTDFPESRDRALNFLKEQGVDWTTYFKTGKDEPFINAISDDWTGAMPFTKIINKEGEVVSYWENSASFSKFEQHVNKALTP